MGGDISTENTSNIPKFICPICLTVQTLKICRTSGPDVMSGKALCTEHQNRFQLSCNQQFFKKQLKHLNNFPTEIGFALCADGSSDTTATREPQAVHFRAPRAQPSSAVHTVYWAGLSPTDWQRGNSVYHAPKNLSFAQGSRAPRSGGVDQAIASSSYLPIVWEGTFRVAYS